MKNKYKIEKLKGTLKAKRPELDKFIKRDIEWMRDKPRYSDNVILK